MTTVLLVVGGSLFALVLLLFGVALLWYRRRRGLLEPPPIAWRWRLVCAVMELVGAHKAPPTDAQLEGQVNQRLAKLGLSWQVPARSELSWLWELIELGRKESLPHLTGMGRVVEWGNWRERLQSASCVHHYLKEHPEVAEIELGTDPIVVTGMARAGTTALWEYLRSDPCARPLFWHEIAFAAPPGSKRADPQKSGPEHAPADWVANMAMTHHLFPRMVASHSGAFDRAYEFIEEELQIVLQSYFFEQMSARASPYQLLRDPDSPLLHQVPDMLFTTMRLASINNPPVAGGHWCFKSVSAGLFLPRLVQQFPDGLYVQLWRDPVSCALSLANLMSDKYAHKVRDLSREALAIEMGWFQYNIEMLLRHRAALSEEDDRRLFLDLRFEDFIADPRAVVRTIYDQAGKTVTPAFERALDAQIGERERRQATRSHLSRYSAERFGVDADEMRSSYRAMFQDAAPAHLRDWLLQLV